MFYLINQRMPLNVPDNVEDSTSNVVEPQKILSVSLSLNGTSEIARDNEESNNKSTTIMVRIIK